VILKLAEVRRGAFGSPLPVGMLLVVKSTHFQWVMPIVGLLYLGRKTAARDRLADLAYRIIAVSVATLDRILGIILYELLDLYL